MAGNKPPPIDLDQLTEDVAKVLEIWEAPTPWFVADAIVDDVGKALHRAGVEVKGGGRDGLAA
jgi:hypothetical protein